MADTYYAWSNFRGAKKPIKAGDKVTAADLDVSDEQFAEYVDSGAVRTYKFPNMPEGFDGSPHELRLRQARAMAEGKEYQELADAAAAEAAGGAAEGSR